MNRFSSTPYFRGSKPVFGSIKISTNYNCMLFVTLRKKETKRGGGSEENLERRDHKIGFP
jgi:hypothetical protein